MSKHSIQITDDKLFSDIVEYCKLNNEKISNFCQRILKKQLAIEKYGDTPFGKIIENNSYPQEYNDELDNNEEASTTSFMDPHIPEYFKKTKERIDKIESTGFIDSTNKTEKPEIIEEKVEDIKTKKRRL